MKKGERRRFTKYEISKILELGKTKTPKEISFEIGALTRTIGAILRKNGISPINEKKCWTEDETKMFLELYPIMPQTEIIKIFGRSKDAIQTFACKQKIKKLVREDGLRIFENDEIDKILFFSQTMSSPELAKLFERDNSSIIALLKRNGIKPISSKRWWTKDEESFLIGNYVCSSPEELSSKLKKKWKTIQKKARTLGLYRTRADGSFRNFPRPLSKTEELFILNNYEGMSSGDMAKKIQRDGNLVISFCRKNNLLSKRSRRNPSKFSDKQLLDSIIEKEKILGRTPLIEEMQKDRTLPSTDTYFDRFGSFTNACKLAGVVPNNGSFGKICFSKNGDVCFSIQEQIITNFLIDNNVVYEKEKLYQKIVKTKRKYRMDWFVDNSIVVEYFGLDSEVYNNKTKIKISLCQENDIPMISIFPKEINNLNKIFKFLM